MTMPNPAKILRAPGRLCTGPTDLSLAFPHGGTALGVMRAVAVRTGVRTISVTAEEFGGEVVEKVFGGESWMLVAILRDFDRDVLASVFPNSSVGTVSQERKLTGPGTLRPGHLLSSRAVALLFSPDAPDAPAVYLPKAIPILADGMELGLAYAEPLEVMVGFQAIRNATKGSYQIARLQDISL